MRGCIKAALAFGLTAMISAPAMAQGGRGGMGMGQGGVNLIGNPSVQKELKLDDDQIKKAGVVAQDLRDKMGEMRTSLEGLEKADATKKMQTMVRGYNDEGMKTLGTFLKPEQLKRFKQIELQQAGINVVNTHPEVMKALKFTDEQTTKVKALLADQAEQMTDAREAAGDDRAAMMTKMTEIRKKTHDKAMALMTEQQKATWKELTGEPFTVVQGPRPGAPGR